MRALFSGVSGIRSHQVRMDVIGNNIANVNTTGFKGSRVTFQDMFSQTLSQGSAQTNPQQVGLGVGVASTDLNTTAGSLQLTGRDLDLAIEGAGMFVLKGSDGAQVYTRAGNFDWDSGGYLTVPGTGARVQGWAADAQGQFGVMDSTTLGNIQVVKGSPSLAQKTGNVTLSGNLNAGALTTDPAHTAPFTAYDSQGKAVPIILKFTKSATDTWNVTAVDASGTTIPSTSASVIFGANGLPTSTSSSSTTLSLTSTHDIVVDLTKITQGYAQNGSSTVLAHPTDGYPMGTLESVTVDANGTVFGTYSNNFRRALAQLATANFANIGGLAKSGSTNFTESSASGTAMIGTPTTGGRGRLIPSNLEMSNVDLSTEFTNMIMTQRGFQANTKVISAADEMLQDLVNLRR